LDTITVNLYLNAAAWKKFMDMLGMWIQTSWLFEGFGKITLWLAS